MEETKQKIMEIFKKELGIEKNYQEGEFDLDLLKGNVIDSLNIVSLISAFEGEFNIKFDPEDITSTDWNTVNAIINTVTNKIQKVEA